MHQKEISFTKLSGRDLGMAINEKTVGAKKMSLGIFLVHPKTVCKPCHTHLGVEEVVHILKGEGKVWVDGETAPLKTGDFVFFPEGSKHMIKNESDKIMTAMFIFAPPTDPSKYVLHPEIDFPEP